MKRLESLFRDPGPASRAIALTTLFFTFLPSLVDAVSFDNQPKILLHAQGVTAKNACEAVAIADCQDAVTQADLISGGANYQFVYVLTGKGDMPNVEGMSFGISYQNNCPDNDMNDLAGLDIFSWSLCATLQLQSPTPVWPKPYSGILLTWDVEERCQTGDVAVAGYFYCGAYSDDILQIIPRPVDNIARLNTCFNDEHYLDAEDLGFVAFSSGGATPGCNPCDGPCPGALIPPPAPPCIPPPPPPPTQPAILLHVTSVTSKNACAFGALESCSTAVVKGGLSEVGGPYYFAYVVVNRGTMPDVAGVQFGISYDNNLPDGAANNSKIDLSWTLCAALEFPMPSPTWPNPGSGNLITWNPSSNCQNGKTAVAGYFYVGAYEADILRITPRPVDGEAKLATCLAAETPVTESNLGFAAFSEGAVTDGCNPCFMDCAQAVPVRQTTWSGVKALFR